MIPRYENQEVAEIHTDLAKLLRWQETELAVILARVKLGKCAQAVYDQIRDVLEANPPDVDWWLQRDALIHHDFNAFLEERLRFIPPELQHEFHKEMTSYDGEDPAFVRALLQSSNVVDEALSDLLNVLSELACEHRFTIMLERTHGQWAELKSFGARVLTWLSPLQDDHRQFHLAIDSCRRSRIAGAVGNYGGGLTPEVEHKALQILGLSPFYGATQIAPRELYAPLAQSLSVICETLAKIATDIRLGARSGTPIYHEPFSKVQKGSSAMPHKRNTILTEQMCGMVIMAQSANSSIVSSIRTWEGRGIEQSCIERVEWPDLFHITMRMIKVMTRVLGGLVVYPDHMLEEIAAAKGTYASGAAKNFLAEECGRRGVAVETAYRIMQLACFDVFEPNSFWAGVRAAKPGNLFAADELLRTVLQVPPQEQVSIQTFIPAAKLFPIEEKLEATEEQVDEWNELLRDIFSDPEAVARWDGIFQPSNLLQGEECLFRRLIGSY